MKKPKGRRGLGIDGPLFIGNALRISPVQGGLLKEPDAEGWLENGGAAEVVSSDVAAIAYDKSLMQLAVTFRDGSTYDYHFVSPVKALMMYNCSSMGVFVHQHLKGRHHAVKR